jgi:hypothetical protein
MKELLLPMNAPPNNGMHPTPLQQQSHGTGVGARVMPGVSRADVLDYAAVGWVKRKVVGQ